MGAGPLGENEISINSKKYPVKLNPYHVLGYYCNNSNALKKIFKSKMKGNENPDVRLAYDMLVNSDDYTTKDYETFEVKNKDIFYFAHIGSIEGIKHFLQQSKKNLEQRDKLGRTIFYIAARNGYYSLCKYLIKEGADVNAPQSYGSTPLQGAVYYGHESIAKLIEEENKKKNISASSKEKRNEENLTKYNINVLDYIFQKNCHPNYDYFNFFNFLKENHSSIAFNHISIFDKEKYSQYKKMFYQKYENKCLTDFEKKCIGSMLGMPIGDAIGARVEFYKLSYEFNGVKDMGNGPGGVCKLQPGQWTDDTSMGLCLADSLLENNGKFDGHDFMMRLMCWWYFGYNNTFRFDDKRPKKHSIGLGGNVHGSFKQYINEYGKNEYTTHGTKQTSGNGSIIRNAAIPICYYKNWKLALDIAYKQSKVTHQGDEAACCCQLLTYIIIRIFYGENLKNILNNLNQFNCNCPSVIYLANSFPENNDPNRNWNWKDPNFKYSPNRAQSNPGYIGSYAMDAMAMALHVLYYTNSFQEAVLKGANLRGDADSVADVIGQIAGAYYGFDNIPEEWIQTIYNWDKYREIPLRAYILCHLFDGGF